MAQRIPHLRDYDRWLNIDSFRVSRPTCFDHTKQVGWKMKPASPAVSS